MEQSPTGPSTVRDVDTELEAVALQSFLLSEGISSTVHPFETAAFVGARRRDGAWGCVCVAPDEVERARGLAAAWVSGEPADRKPPQSEQGTGGHTARRGLGRFGAWLLALVAASGVAIWFLPQLECVAAERRAMSAWTALRDAPEAGDLREWADEGLASISAGEYYDVRFQRVGKGPRLARAVQQLLDSIAAAERHRLDVCLAGERPGPRSIPRFP